MAATAEVAAAVQVGPSPDPSTGTRPKSFSIGGRRRRYFLVAAAAKALLAMDRAPGDRATKMMYATRVHAAVPARGRVVANPRLAAERRDTSA